MRDTELGREARMAYDLAERPVEAELYEDGALTYRLTQEYNRFNQPSVLHERVEEPLGTRSEHTLSAEYDKESRPAAITYESARMTGIGVPDETRREAEGRLGTEIPRSGMNAVAATRSGAADRSKRKLAYVYDGLGRIENRSFRADVESAPVFQCRYTYADGGYGLHSTTSLVKVIQQAGLRHVYTYDTRGNITRETRHGKAMAGGELSFDERRDAGLFFRRATPHLGRGRAADGVGRAL